jgi:hypothetical protein
MKPPIRKIIPTTLIKRLQITASPCQTLSFSRVSQLISLPREKAHGMGVWAKTNAAIKEKTISIKPKEQSILADRFMDCFPS